MQLRHAPSREPMPMLPFRRHLSAEKERMEKKHIVNHSFGSDGQMDTRRIYLEKHAAIFGTFMVRHNGMQLVFQFL